MALIRNVRLVVLCAVFSYLAAAQPPSRFVGTVQSVKAEQGEIAIKPDQGDTRTAKVIPETIFQRVAPGEKDLKQAQPIQLRDVAAGDRVLVTLEPGTEDLRRLVVMPASDIAKRNEADRLDWQKRGLSGVVAARTGNEITLKMRSMMSETQAVVTVGEKTSFRRYAPDSVKFADAKPSNLAEVSLGDQLRARGEKSEDGSKVMAQEVIFGTFLTKAGKIATVNPQTREIAIVELNTNKPLLIRLTADSQLKQMPNFPAMGVGGGMPGGSMPGGPPAGGMRPGGMPGAPGMGGVRPPDLSQMLERMPAAKIEDMQPGQTIVVSSTKGATKDELTAIMVLANADMLIRMASMQQAAKGMPGMQGQMGAMGGAGMMGGASGGLSSGGLEGMQLPGIMP